MKITVSKHTTIDWEKVQAEMSNAVLAAVRDLIAEAKTKVDELAEGESKTVSTDIGKITIRRSKD